MSYNASVTFEESKDKYIVPRVIINDKYKYIGSKYNMKNNIEKFIRNIKDADNDTIFVLFGLGAAEHIKSIRRKYISNVIIVFEPNEELIEAVLNNEKLQWIKKDKKIVITVYTSDKFMKEMKSLVCAENVHKVQYYSCFNYDLLYPVEYLDFFKKSKDSTIDKVRTLNTRKRFSEIWFRNMIENLNAIAEGEPVNSFINMYKNKPAIIVSAGPSFDENLKYLKDLKDEMLLFIGGRNLRAFTENNIKPHLLTIVDPVKESFEIVREYIGECEAPLLFYEGSNSEAVNTHRNEKIFYTQSPIPNYMFDERVLNIGVGGSVAHTITKFAVISGCNPIIFVGQDLAYRDDKMHAESTKTIGKEYSNKNAIITVEGYGGKRQVKTDISLERYKYELETIINDNPSITFINSSEGGARIKGTVEMSLKDAIDTYKTDVSKMVIRSKYNRELIGKKTKDIVLNAKISAENIIKLSKEGLGKLVDYRITYLSNNKSNFSKISSELEILESKISEIYNETAIFQSILYPIFLSAANQKKNLESDFNTKMEYINTIKNRKHKIFTELIDKSQYILETLENIKE